MRSILFWTLALSCLLLIGLTGCSNKGIDLNKDATIAYDKARDGEPAVMGGPGGKGAANGLGMAGKGKFGSAAAGTAPAGTTPPK